METPMTEKNIGGYAYPISGVDRGLTIRDWFAGQALRAIIGRPEWPDLIIASEEAYRQADAMIAEREK